ncbi:secondary metabolite protein [Streptomyces sp900116325]|uniref:secondary metabolite protein n=1 Tax=Streptomyces sp. 900116325 TaxID=3154295 RepID=UPI0033C84668
MLKQHRGNTAVSGENLSGLVTDINPSTVQMVIGRTRYDEPEEFDAEMLESLLQEHVVASRAVASRTSRDDDPIARTLLRRPK